MCAIPVPSILVPIPFLYHSFTIPVPSLRHASSCACTYISQHIF